jgi:hypothetical protein
MDGDKWAADDHDAFVGDFDGNGFSDVILVPRTAVQQARLLLADGSGGFQSAQVLTWSFGLDGTRWNTNDHAPAVLDLDGDGFDDLLLQGRTNQRRTRWLRGGTGGFQSATDVTFEGDLDVAAWAGHALTAADFDGDGDDDIVLQGATSGDDHWLVRGGPGGVEATYDAVGAGGLFGQDWASTRHVATTGDVDGDGKADLLLRGTDDSRDTLLALGGPALFQAAIDVTDVQDLGPPQWSDDARQGVLLDADGDGRDDVFLRGRTGDDKSYLIYLPRP